MKGERRVRLHELLKEVSHLMFCAYPIVQERVRVSFFSAGMRPRPLVLAHCIFRVGLSSHVAVLKGMNLEWMRVFVSCVTGERSNFEFLVNSR